MRSLNLKCNDDTENPDGFNLFQAQRRKNQFYKDELTESKVGARGDREDAWDPHEGHRGPDSAAEGLKKSMEDRRIRQSGALGTEQRTTLQTPTPERQKTELGQTRAERFPQSH